MRMCGTCGMKMAVADTSMLKHWIEMAGANHESWRARVGDRTAFVCPACDSYALGAEISTGMPFYSEAVGAFLTVTDWDWWNRDPQECDIRPWPDFGCLTFSEDALRSTVVYLHDKATERLDSAPLLASVTGLLGPTGIPEGGNPEAEWERQLKSLHARMGGELSKRELDVAVRYLIEMIA